MGGPRFPTFPVRSQGSQNISFSELSPPFLSSDFNSLSRTNPRGERERAFFYPTLYLVINNSFPPLPLLLLLSLPHLGQDYNCTRKSFFFSFCDLSRLVRDPAAGHRRALDLGFFRGREQMKGVFPEKKAKDKKAKRPSLQQGSPVSFT